MTVGEYPSKQDVALHADQTLLGAVLVDHCQRIEEILGCAGISRPLAWHQESWDPVISLYVRKDWCYCDATVDEDAWHDAEERIRAEIEWPVRLVELTTGGAQAMVGLQALSAATPWAGIDLSWVHDLENTMRAGLITWPDLAAQMENRLRETVG